MTRPNSLFAALAHQPRALLTASALLGFLLVATYEMGHRTAYQHVDALGYQLMACEDALGEAWEMAETNGVAAPAWVAAEVTR